MTSQPAISAILAATDHTERESGLSIDRVGDLEPYWEAVRAVYAPFEAGLAAPTGTVYRHEIPGGQLSNLRQQAIALGLGDRFELVEVTYAECNQLLGRPIKVTPSSKVVGDLALHLVASNVTAAELLDDPSSVDLPDSVIAFLQGDLGEPPGGFPEPFRTKALEGRDREVTKIELADSDRDALLQGDVRATLSRLLLEGPAASFAEHADRYGDLSVLPSRAFWYGLEMEEDDIAVSLGRGVRLLVGLEAIGEPNAEGMRSVVFRLNGQLRPIDIRDQSVTALGVTAEKASPSQPGHVPAPFRGLVSVTVKGGQEVEAGDAVAVIEAMKMESQISAPLSGVVERLAVEASAQVEPGDLLVVIRPTGTASSPETEEADS